MYSITHSKYLNVLKFFNKKPIENQNSGLLKLEVEYNMAIKWNTTHMAKKKSYYLQ